MCSLLIDVKKSFQENPLPTQTRVLNCSAAPLRAHKCSCSNTPTTSFGGGANSEREIPGQGLQKPCFFIAQFWMQWCPGARNILEKNTILLRSFSKKSWGRDFRPVFSNGSWEDSPGTRAPTKHALQFFQEIPGQALEMIIVYYHIFVGERLCEANPGARTAKILFGKYPGAKVIFLSVFVWKIPGRRLQKEPFLGDLRKEIPGQALNMII